jgi:hypothetical protein
MFTLSRMFLAGFSTYFALFCSEKQLRSYDEDTGILIKLISFDCSRNHLGTVPY